MKQNKRRRMHVRRPVPIEIHKISVRCIDSQPAEIQVPCAQRFEATSNGRPDSLGVAEKEIAK